MTPTPTSTSAPTTSANPATGEVTPDALGDALAAVRQGAPLTQCLTNIVVAGFTANVLLAVGAAPAMSDNPHEAGQFAQIAGGVLVNLGTPYADTVTGMEHAVRAAVSRDTPWVLDPVAAGVLTYRTEFAHRLLQIGAPAIIRGNASEIAAMSGGEGGRGVDSTMDPADVRHVAHELARHHGCVIAVSGPEDFLTDGTRDVRLANGHEWMTRVTGVGCALGALMAAFAATVRDPLVAASAATATLTVAAEDAAAATRGPGGFAVALLDELSLLTPESLADRAEVV